MALWYALNDPLLQLEWTLDNLLQESKLDKPSTAMRRHAQNNPKPQQPLSTTPKWAAAMPAGQFDVIETPEAFELVTDAPGFSPSDITVDFNDGVLTISGTHSEHKPEETQQQQQQQVERPKQVERQQQLEHKEGRAGQQTLAAPAEPAVKVWRKERYHYTFTRSFKLPADVKAEDIAAQLDKGVLIVRVPKLPPAPKPQPKRIAVQGAPAKAV